MSSSIINGKYRHYRGHEYEVLGLALDTVHKQKVASGRDEGEPTVVYRALYDCEDLEDRYGIRPLFTRTLESFTSEIELDTGERVPMFTYVGPMG